jgi:hypothetical protein
MHTRIHSHRTRRTASAHAGLATVGCTAGTRCVTWINGRYAGEAGVYFHEMGHNLGLLHSGRADIPWIDSSDGTCMMGT